MPICWGVVQWMRHLLMYGVLMYSVCTLHLYSEDLDQRTQDSCDFYRISITLLYLDT